MGKKIIPLLYRTPYYPFYTTFLKAPFTFKDTNITILNTNKINLELINFLQVFEKKFINFDFKIFYNKKNIIIYIQFPIELKLIKSTLLTKLFNHLNLFKLKFNKKYKNFYTIYFDIIYSKLNLNYSTYFWFVSIDILKTKYSLKFLFKELYLKFIELNKINDIIKGFKIKISGRINGVELAKNEIFKIGNISLHTILNSIQYKSKYINTKFGSLGIKIWVFIIKND
uniref:30S ribosomal protein S3 n=1 Tax=Nephromyces sp. ex Molgula occidentalis TaxID=2544991 RepID=A0A5C1H8E4_9APIC|nr:30S ribosomal protein S3 [Nephromyces sp. ex Molgula occidentalis]